MDLPLFLCPTVGRSTVLISDNLDEYRQDTSARKDYRAARSKVGIVFYTEITNMDAWHSRIRHEFQGNLRKHSLVSAMRTFFSAVGSAGLVASLPIGRYSGSRAKIIAVVSSIFIALAFCLRNIKRPQLQDALNEKDPQKQINTLSLGVDMDQLLAIAASDEKYNASGYIPDFLLEGLNNTKAEEYRKNRPQFLEGVIKRLKDTECFVAGKMGCALPTKLAYDGNYNALAYVLMLESNNAKRAELATAALSRAANRDIADLLLDFGADSRNGVIRDFCSSRNNDVIDYMVQGLHVSVDGGERDYRSWQRNLDEAAEGEPEILTPLELYLTAKNYEGKIIEMNSMDVERVLRIMIKDLSLDQLRKIIETGSKEQVWAWLNDNGVRIRRKYADQMVEHYQKAIAPGLGIGQIGTK